MAANRALVVVGVGVAVDSVGGTGSPDAKSIVGHR